MDGSRLGGAERAERKLSRVDEGLLVRNCLKHGSCVFWMTSKFLAKTGLKDEGWLEDIDWPLASSGR